MFRSRNASPSHLVYIDTDSYMFSCNLGYHSISTDEDNGHNTAILHIKSYYTNIKFYINIYGYYYYGCEDGDVRYFINLQPIKLNKGYYQVVCIKNNMQTEAPFGFNIEPTYKDNETVDVKLKITYLGNTRNTFRFVIKPYLYDVSLKHIMDIRLISTERIDVNTNNIKYIPYEYDRFYTQEDANATYLQTIGSKSKYSVIICDRLENYTNPYSIRISKKYTGCTILFNADCLSDLIKDKRFRIPFNVSLDFYDASTYTKEKSLMDINGYVDDNNSMTKLNIMVDITIVYDGDDTYNRYFHIKTLSNNGYIKDDMLTIIGYMDNRSSIKPANSAVASLIPEKKTTK